MTCCYASKRIETEENGLFQEYLPGCVPVQAKVVSIAPSRSLAVGLSTGLSLSLCLCVFVCGALSLSLCLCFGRTLSLSPWALSISKAVERRRRAISLCVSRRRAIRLSLYVYSTTLSKLKNGSLMHVCGLFNPRGRMVQIR